ncbi:hypothetical protein MPER_08741, partial [Moniliophthora perniciosa FA553]
NGDPTLSAHSYAYFMAFSSYLTQHLSHYFLRTQLEFRRAAKPALYHDGENLRALAMETLAAR